MNRRRTDPDFFQRMRNVDARRGTFHDFPRSSPVRSQDLAEAGFYYTGSTDQVTCPFCRGSVVDWEEGDIPMEEHRRHFPLCSFIKESHGTRNDVTQGDDVADAARRIQPTVGNQTKTTTQSTVTTTARTTTSTKTTPASDILQNWSHPNVQKRHNVEARDLRARMERPMAIKLVEMGFNLDTMKKVMMQRLMTSGEDFASAQDFAAAVMDYEDEQERQKSGSGDKCKSCRDRKRDTVLLPCGHLLYCHVCADRNNYLYCEQCGTKIKGTNRSP